MGCLPRMERGLIVGIIVEAIITGILTGGVYALMASGLTLVFGVMDIINVGQGALVILGAYLSFFLEQKLHIDLFVGLLITMPVMFGLGLLIEWLFIRPIKRDRTMLSILVTFGVALIIEGFLNIGGMGILGGALIASVGMLVVEDVTSVVWSPVWASTVFFILLVIILLVRPQGLFGQVEGRKQ